jgi:ABC-type nitrate/sulfonate/bicarbonate transport system substrate-binding protein
LPAVFAAGRADKINRKRLLGDAIMGKKTGSKVILILSAFVAIGTVLAVYASKSGKITRPADEIRMLGSTSPVEWEIANKLSGKDVFKEEGVKINIISGSSASGPRYQALLTNQLDVEGGAWIGWINIRARGGKIKAVINGGLQTKERKAGIMVLNDSPIRSIKDLKGKSIAVNTLGLTAEYTLKEALRRNGMSIDQVQLVTVPTENQEQVLRSKQVDGALDAACSATWIEMAFARGGVRIIPGTSNYEVRGENASTGTGFTEEFINKHPAAVRGYVSAMEKTRRYLWEEFKKNPEKVRKAYAEVAAQKGGNPKLANFFIPAEPNYNFNTKRDIQWWIDILEKEGKIKSGSVKAEDVYTDEFNPFYGKNAGYSEKKQAI